MGLRPIQVDEDRRDGDRTSAMVSMSPPLQSGLGLQIGLVIANRTPTVREGTLRKGQNIVIQRSG